MTILVFSFILLPGTSLHVDILANTSIPYSFKNLSMSITKYSPASSIIPYIFLLVVSIVVSTIFNSPSIYDTMVRFFISPK